MRRANTGLCGAERERMKEQELVGVELEKSSKASSSCKVASTAGRLRISAPLPPHMAQAFAQLGFSEGEAEE